MSLRVMAAVWDGYPAGGSELLALLALADWSDDDGRCWPSMAAIARKTRLSRSQSQRVIHKLIVDGFLALTGNETGGAPGSTRQYRIVLSSLTGRMGATGGTSATGRMGATEGSHVCGETGRIHDTQYVSYTKPKEGEPPASPDASASVSPSASANPKKQIFDLGVSLLTQHGDSEKSARAFLAKFAKQDEAKLGEVLGHLAAHPKVEPKSYIAAALKPKVRELAL